MQLTNSQTKAVDQLYSCFLNKKSDKYCLFKAPTGSGKTFMSSSLISKILYHNTSQGIKTMVLVGTISNAELPLQFSNKLNTYKKYHEFNSYEVEFISSPSNTKSNKSEDIKDFDIKENKVYVFGKSSFGKNTLFYQNKTLESFFTRAKAQGYSFIYIRDEAHIGGKGTLSKNEAVSFDQKISKVSDFIVEMTATPKSERRLVELRREDMEEDGRFLLKRWEKRTNLVGETISNEDIIDDAIQSFKKTKQNYLSLHEVVNPAMLVQVSNNSTVDKSARDRFKEGLALLESKLKAAGLKYLVYFGEVNYVVGAKVPPTLEYASRKDSVIDVIIFKIGPATGWDIPRANMLLQLRDVSSEFLNVQTVGRIIRNPLSSLEDNEVTNKYYLYSNFQKPTRDDVWYKLKDHFKEKTLYFGYIDNNSKEFSENKKTTKTEISSFLKSSRFINSLKDISKENVIYDSLDYGNGTVVKNYIENIYKLILFNRNKAEEYKNIINLSDYETEFKFLSEKTKKTKEIILFVLWRYMGEIKKIISKNTTWIHNVNPYKIERSGKLLRNYNIWKDNEAPKVVNSEKDYAEKYGYIQITEENPLQYLDSNPEREFYQKFNEAISRSQREKISFFAKMPTLGSKIFFEYYSQKTASIKKSYMDFAIEYKNKTIMVEVKSLESDYDPEKTKELQNAYKLYMEKGNKSNLSLVLYQLNDKSDLLSAFIDGEWREDWSFRDVFDSLLK